MKDPRKLSKADLVDIVSRVQQALWPRSDAEHQWSPDTLDEISNVMVDVGLGPESNTTPDLDANG
jgi:hypothetical protein